MEDAVLAALFPACREDRALADEFFAHLFRAPLPRAPQISPMVRRHLESSDLVQSVLGELWSSMDELRFESRAQFLALVGRRLRWKLQDHDKRLRRSRRREEKRVEAPPGGLDVECSRSSPATAAAEREEAARIAAAIGRLAERDRLLLRKHLRGEPLETIARELRLAPEAARKALARARRRLGEVL